MKHYQEALYKQYRWHALFHSTNWIFTDFVNHISWLKFVASSYSTGNNHHVFQNLIDVQNVHCAFSLSLTDNHLAKLHGALYNITFVVTSLLNLLAHYCILWNVFVCCFLLKLLIFVLKLVHLHLFHFRHIMYTRGGEPAGQMRRTTSRLNEVAW